MPDDPVIPQRVPAKPRWSHGYEFSLSVEQLDWLCKGEAKTEEGQPITLLDIGPFRFLATIEVLLEEAAKQAEEHQRSVEWLLHQMQNRDLETIRNIGKTYPKD